MMPRWPARGARRWRTRAARPTWSRAWRRSASWRPTARAGERLEALRRRKREIKAKRKLKGRLEARGVTALTDDETLAEAVRVAKNQLPVRDRVGRALRDAVERGRTDIPRAVAEAGITPEMVEADVKAEHDRWKSGNILRAHPAMPDVQIDAAVDRWKGIPGRYYALRELAKAMRSGREVDNLALAVVGPQKAVRVRWSPDRWRLRSLPTLFTRRDRQPADRRGGQARHPVPQDRRPAERARHPGRRPDAVEVLAAGGPDAERTRATAQAAIEAFAAGQPHRAAGHLQGRGRALRGPGRLGQDVLRQPCAASTSGRTSRR